MNSKVTTKRKGNFQNFRDTKETFVAKAQKKHGDLYDYSAVVYEYSQVKVAIRCKKHGIFYMTPSKHLMGQGCPICNNPTVAKRTGYARELFIEKMKKLYGDVFTYDKLVYNGIFEKVTLTCKIHGDFTKTANYLMTGHGCPKCLPRRHNYTQEEFVEKSTKAHKGKYTYEHAVYLGSDKPITVTCKLHGDFLVSEASKHMHGYCKCPVCKDAAIRHKKYLSAEESKRKKEQIRQHREAAFIEKATKKFNGRYDYSRVHLETLKSVVTIGCPEHGFFEQKACDHLDTHNGCPYCGGTRALTQEMYLRKAREIHGDTYDYSLVEYKNGASKIKIICPIHGVFEQRARAHTYERQGCPRCCASHGESTIRHFLQRHNIKFVEQYRISDCKNKKPLPFDFAIFNQDGTLRCLIEYQGIQHFKEYKFYGHTKGLEQRKRLDKIKEDYCKNNGILLFQISCMENLSMFLNSKKELTCP